MPTLALRLEERANREIARARWFAVSVDGWDADDGRGKMVGTTIH